MVPWILKKKKNRVTKMFVHYYQTNIKSELTDRSETKFTQNSPVKPAKQYADNPPLMPFKVTQFQPIAIKKIQNEVTLFKCMWNIFFCRNECTMRQRWWTHKFVEDNRDGRPFMLRLIRFQGVVTCFATGLPCSCIYSWPYVQLIPSTKSYLHWTFKNVSTA